MVRLGCFLLATALLAGCASQKTAEPETPVVNAAAGPKHPVTDKMATVADKTAGLAAVDFELKDAEGKTWSMAENLKNGPVVVLSIKDGCPCSVDSQPLFNGLAKKFQGKATFVGLFDQNAEKAKTYIKDNSVNFPVVINEDLEVFKQYKAERSVYVSIVTTDGKIVKQWPGYWVDMLNELDGKLEELTGFDGAPFDVAYAPKTPTSGCQLYEGEGFAPGDVR